MQAFKHLFALGILGLTACGSAGEGLGTNTSAGSTAAQFSIPPDWNVHTVAGSPDQGIEPLNFILSVDPKIGIDAVISELGSTGRWGEVGIGTGAFDPFHGKCISAETASVNVDGVNANANQDISLRVNGCVGIFDIGENHARAYLQDTGAYFFSVAKENPCLVKRVPPWWHCIANNGYNQARDEFLSALKDAAGKHAWFLNCSNQGRPSGVGLNGVGFDGTAIACKVSGELNGADAFRSGPIVSQNSPAAALNSDGRAEVFAMSGGQLQHIWQQTPGGTWSGMSSLQGGLHSAPAIGTNADGRLEAFAVGPDNHIWHIWQKCAGCGWSGWSKLGGDFYATSAPAVAANQDGTGRLEVFARGQDSALWHIWQCAPGSNCSWSGWSSLGGSLASEPVVYSDVLGIKVFAVQADGFVMTRGQDSAGKGWSAPWATFGGAMAGPPVPMLDDTLTVNLFALGNDGHVYRRADANPNSSAKWVAVTSTQPTFVGYPAVGQNTDMTFEIFAQADDMSIRYTKQATPGGAFGPWQTLGTAPGASDPTVLADGQGRLNVFASQDGETIWGAWQTIAGGSWTTLAPLPGR